MTCSEPASIVDEFSDVRSRLGAVSRATLTIEHVFRLKGRGTVFTPLLDPERFPRDSAVKLEISKPNGSTAVATGRFELWEFLREGHCDWKGVVVLDPDHSDAVSAGDVLAIEL